MNSVKMVFVDKAAHLILLQPLKTSFPVQSHYLMFKWHLPLSYTKVDRCSDKSEPGVVSVVVTVKLADMVTRQKREFVSVLVTGKLTDVVTIQKPGVVSAVVTGKLTDVVTKQRTGIEP
ncbi:hypothetical protein J6590_085403 [Homalodisca vitripennis]|nr:hypothetical protein J6590_085403 [Homalodisca vitripennis]